MMTCEKWREEIEDTVGCATLSAELLGHLESCEPCRQYQSEIELALKLLSTDELSMNREEADRFLQDVNRKIDRVSTKKDSKPVWLKFLSAAAIVLFLVGSLKVVYEYQSRGISVSSAEESDPDPLATLFDSPLDSLNSEDMNVTLQVLVPNYQYGVEEAIIKGLSDDNMEYLEQNFQVGDLL